KTATVLRAVRSSRREDLVIGAPLVPAWNVRMPVAIKAELASNRQTNLIRAARLHPPAGGEGGSDQQHTASPVTAKGPAGPSESSRTFGVAKPGAKKCKVSSRFSTEAGIWI